ncbi:MAG: iron ABC transporter permease [Verrucomicrobiae bacterium]|nr:iron ABC transporter permease [Verrucomicrobiae bacterium]
MSTPFLSNRSLPPLALGVIGIGLLAVLLPLALWVGAAQTSGRDLWTALTGGGDEQLRLIIFQIRLPRLILGFMVGAALAVAGVVFQALLINPLASPFTLGISSGAAFAASLAIMAGLSLWMLPFLGLIGAGLTLALVLLLSRGRGGFDPRSLILAGVVVGAIFSAGISLVKSLSGESLSAIVFWIMGSLASRGWFEAQVFLPYFVIGLAGILFLAKDLDLLCLGGAQARSLGVDVAFERQLLLFFASLLAAAAVSVSGVIGFVGLVVPHMLRMVSGPRHTRLCMLSALYGGILLLAADTLARVLSRTTEIPVGVITSLLGGPFFCLLLMRRERSDET